MKGALVGHPFATRTLDLASPFWNPLESVARTARRHADLPPFHEGELTNTGRIR